MRKLAAAIAAFLLLTAATSTAKSTVRPQDILNAMEQELVRAKNELRLEDFDPPYFVSYTLKLQRGVAIESSNGATFTRRPMDKGKLAVQIRVGSYEFDNFDPEKPGSMFSFSSDNLREFFQLLNAPVKEDKAALFALRRRLWLLSDLAYKEAISSYLEKKARQVNLLKEEELPDFSREEPQTYIEADRPFRFNADRWEKLARRESAYLASFPELRTNSITIKAYQVKRYFVNSEGTRIYDTSEYFVFNAECRALAEDGMPIDNFYVFYSRSLDDLPEPDEIHAEIERMVEETLALRKAPLIDPYTGPALLDASVCAVFFHEAIGHRLEGERQRAHEEGQTFTKKLGQKVIPEFISVIDDPTLKRWTNGEYLNGYYLFDDEGVKAQRVVLIEDGILKNFLLSRTPIKGFLHSNGHGRAASYQRPMARMANTIVLSSKTHKWSELKQMLMEMAKEKGKPFGLIIKKATGGETHTQRAGIQAFRNRPVLIYKVDIETGEETLVRGAEIVGTPLVSINKIVATSDRYSVFNGMCGAESGFIPVATVAPDILVSEIELQKVSFKPQRPPILKPPMPGGKP